MELLTKDQAKALKGIEDAFTTLSYGAETASESELSRQLFDQIKTRTIMLRTLLDSRFLNPEVQEQIVEHLQMTDENLLVENLRSKDARHQAMLEKRILELNVELNQLKEAPSSNQYSKSYVQNLRESLSKRKTSEKIWQSRYLAQEKRWDASIIKLGEFENLLNELINELDLGPYEQRIQQLLALVKEDELYTLYRLKIARGQLKEWKQLPETEQHARAFQFCQKVCDTLQFKTRPQRFKKVIPAPSLEVAT